MPFDMLGPYLIAIAMSIGAVCLFIWAVLSGALSDTDEAALRFYRTEVGDDRDAG